MSVNPGFGGQSFIASTLNKITQVRARLDQYQAETGRHIRLEVDGGIKVDNIAQVASAGADTFVAGSAIFGKENYASVIEAMRTELGKSSKTWCCVKNLLPSVNRASIAFL